MFSDWRCFSAPRTKSLENVKLTVACFQPTVCINAAPVDDVEEKARRLANTWNVSEATAESWFRGDPTVTNAVDEQFRQHSLKQARSSAASDTSQSDQECNQECSRQNSLRDTFLDTMELSPSRQQSLWEQRQQSEDVIGQSYQRELQEGIMATGNWMQQSVYINPHDIYFCSRANNKLLRIGKGSFGSVYKGVWNGEMVAVKVCNQQTITEKGKLQFQQEVAILHSCSHPNVVQFKGACCWKGGKRTVLVTEYMEKGDLCSAIARAPEKCSWERLGKKMALDIARGLAFLHARNIVHFDLKSGNVLLNNSNTAKLADVGLAKILTDAHGSNLVTFLATADLGTFAWAAPEALLGNACDAKADIYSYGVVLWELCTGETPQGRNLRPIRIPEEAPQAVADLISECLAYEPEARPSAEMICTTLVDLQ